MAVFLQILMVGNPSPSTSRLIFRFATQGYAARRVDTIAEARSVLETFRFAVILAAETLIDGKGYELADLVARRSGNLFVGVPLSETLWLPVVERGVLVLGQRALNASAFENEVEIALGAVRKEIQPGQPRKPGLAAGTSHRVTSSKRRGIEAA